MNTVPEISPEELKTLKDTHADFLLLDVREKWENQAANLGGYLIPLGELPTRLDELDRNKPIVVHCEMGGRSSRAVAYLLENGFKDVKNLRGGLKGYQAACGSAE